MQGVYITLVQETMHNGVIRSSYLSNYQAIMSRISDHSKALYSIIHMDMAKYCMETPLQDAGFSWIYILLPSALQNLSFRDDDALFGLLRNFMMVYFVLSILNIIYGNIFLGL